MNGILSCALGRTWPRLKPMSSFTATFGTGGRHIMTSLCMSGVSPEVRLGPTLRHGWPPVSDSTLCALTKGDPDAILGVSPPEDTHCQNFAMSWSANF